MNDYEKKWLIREVTSDGQPVEDLGTHLYEVLELECRKVNEKEYVVRKGCFRFVVDESKVSDTREAAVARIVERGGTVYEPTGS